MVTSRTLARVLSMRGFNLGATLKPCRRTDGGKEGIKDGRTFPHIEMFVRIHMFASMISLLNWLYEYKYYHCDEFVDRRQNNTQHVQIVSIRAFICRSNNQSHFVHTNYYQPLIIFPPKITHSLFERTIISLLSIGQPATNKEAGECMGKLIVFQLV